MPSPIPRDRRRARRRTAITLGAVAASLAAAGTAQAAYVDGQPVDGFFPASPPFTNTPQKIFTITPGFSDTAVLPAGEPARAPRVGDVLTLRATVKLDVDATIGITFFLSPGLDADADFALSSNPSTGHRCTYSYVTATPGGGGGTCPNQTADGSRFMSGNITGGKAGSTYFIFVPIRVTKEKAGGSDPAGRFDIEYPFGFGTASASQSVKVAAAPAPAPTPTPTPTGGTTTPGGTTPGGTTTPGGQTTGSPAPTSGSPTCNPVPPRTEGAKGTITLSRQALVIQQRIDAAALRRLNAANAWIDAGIVPTDLCGGAFGPRSFATGIRFAGGGASAQSLGRPTPRPLTIVTQDKAPGTFSVDLRQIRINDKISRALLARAQATAQRISSLTGGNLAPGATLLGRPLYPGLTTAGALPGTPDLPPTPLAVGALPAAGPLNVSAAQLRTTQQRSQQAILLANEVNDRIEAGLTEDQFQAGSIGAARLTP